MRRVATEIRILNLEIKESRSLPGPRAFTVRASHPTVAISRPNKEIPGGCSCKASPQAMEGAAGPTVAKSIWDRLGSRVT